MKEQNTSNSGTLSKLFSIRFFFSQLIQQRVKKFINSSFRRKNIIFAITTVVTISFVHSDSNSQPCLNYVPNCIYPEPNPCPLSIRIIFGVPGECGYCDRIPVYFEGEDCTRLNGQSVALQVIRLNSSDSGYSFGHGRDAIDVCNNIRTGGYVVGYPGFSLPAGSWKVKAWMTYAPSVRDEQTINFNPAAPSVNTNATKKDVFCIGCSDGEIRVTRTDDFCHVWSVQLFKDFTIPYGSYQFQNGENSYLFPGLSPGPYTVKFYYGNNTFHSQYGLYINEPYEANLDIGIEGHGSPDSTLFFGPRDSNILDTAKVMLRNITPPFDIVDSTVSAIGQNGNGNFKFYNAVNGTPYYIVVKHRNSLETWSSSGQIFNVNTFNFDFTTNANQAYGNNMVLAGGKYRFYGGDVNQDGVIDLSDVTLVYNDASGFATGYIVTDLTGDDIVDLSDMLIVFNNSSSFVVMMRP